MIILRFFAGRSGNTIAITVAHRYFHLYQEESTMSFVVKKEDEKRYVVLDFEGDVTVSELEQSRAAIQNVLQESKVLKEILVDLQKASLAVSTTEIHQF